jgi:hypothetical protein
LTASGARRGQGLVGGTMAGALGGGAAKVKFGARRGEGALGGALALNSNLARAGLNTSRFGRSQLGRSLLGGSVFSRSPSALHPTAPARKSAPLGRSLTPRRTASMFRSTPGGSATGYTPRLSRPGLLSRLTSALRGTGRRQPRLRSHQSTFRTPLGGGSSLRGRSSLRGSSPSRGWLRRSRSLTGKRAVRLGAGPTRLHMPRPRAKKRRRTGGYR